MSNPLIEDNDGDLTRFGKKILASLLGMTRSQKINAGLRENYLTSLKKLLESRKIAITIQHQEHLKKLDLSKPIALLINHPYGLLDAYLMSYFCETRLHQNYLGFSNKLLKRVVFIPDQNILSVDNQGKKNNRENKVALRLSKKQLEENGILVFAPAGEVSTFQWNSGKPQIKDPNWHETPFKLAQKTNAQILPVYISGRNTRLFYFIRMLGRFPGRLLLFWEYVWATHKDIKLIVKEPLSPEEVNSLSLGELKEQVYNSIYDHL